MYQKAYDGYAKCSGPDSRNALTEREYVASALIDLGRAPEAVTLLEQDMPTWRKLLGENPDLTEPLYYLSLGDVETGQYAKAEALAKEQIDIQTGKVEPSDRRFGMCHLIWARALNGEKRYAEALPHARIADDLLNRNALSASGKKAGAQAHALVLDLEANSQSR
jgi:tetratricopeptide (TPR) repeat protein